MANTPSKEPTKATKAEMASRIEQVLRIRLDGAEFWDVCQYSDEQGWGISHSSIWGYMRKADELIAESMRRNRDEAVAEHLAKRRMLYARSVQAGELSTALSCLKDEAQLMDLYPAARSKAEVTGPNAGPLQTEVTVKDDPAQRFRELYQQVGQERAALVADADGGPQPLPEGEAPDAPPARLPGPDLP